MFAGEETYSSSWSGVVKATVNALPSTQTVLQVPTVVVPVNKPLMMTACLYSNSLVGPPYKQVTIYLSFNGVRYLPN